MPKKSAGSDAMLKQLREATIKTFGQILCLWQLEVAVAILKQDKEVILITATGSGKTLTFWMPLLINTEGI